MSLFREPVKLRGVLGRDAEVPTPRTAGENSYVVLSLLLRFVTVDKPTGMRTVRDRQIPIVCSGPDFCGVRQDMKEGDYIEVAGELRLCEEDGPVVWCRDPRVMRVAGIKVRATVCPRWILRTTAIEADAAFTLLREGSRLSAFSDHAALSSRRKGH